MPEPNPYRSPESVDRGISPVVAGTFCCVVSAVAYTVANFCMRRLAEDCDPTWVTFNKELVTVVVVGLWLLVRAFRRLPTWPGWRTLGTLMLVGLVVQVGANLGVQWALGIIGLSIAIPALFTVMLTAGALLGWVLLGERVSLRSAGAIGLLVVAIPLLKMSAGLTSVSITHGGTPPGPMTVALAVAAVCFAGFVYALLTITIRHATQTTHVTAVVFVITGMAMVSLGPLSVYRLGIGKLASTPGEQFGWMIAAGTFNLIAFLAISKGLQLTTVVHANVLNASQVAMAVVAGWVFFKESMNLWLVLGVALTIAGIILIDRPVDEEAIDQHA